MKLIINDKNDSSNVLVIPTIATFLFCNSRQQVERNTQSGFLGEMISIRETASGKHRQHNLYCLDWCHRHVRPRCQ